jgi:hypothetical protein
MAYAEYRKLSDALRRPCDAAMAAWSADQKEISKARVFREFDRYNESQSRFFETYCRIGA